MVGARIDAEALTRARAMGVRGIVVASLPGKDLRDFRASERRQRASLHSLQPFGVLVLDGTVRRPIPSPVAALLEKIAGRDVSLLSTHPRWCSRRRTRTCRRSTPTGCGCARDRAPAPRASSSGPAGLRRFERGVQLEAAFVAIGGRAPVAFPIGDLERLA